MARLEATVEHLVADLAELKAEMRRLREDIASIRTTDFRLIFGAIITVALGLAALLAKGFQWL